jgi:hypothetical protein
LLTVADQRTQLAELLGRNPDAGQIADTFEVGQDTGVGEVGLVGRLLHAADETGMSEVNGPGEAIGQLFGEIGSAGAGFEGGALEVPNRWTAASAVQSACTHPPSW